MGKGSFILYDKDLKGVILLTDCQAGKLFKALATYRLEGKNASFGNNVAVTILFQQLIDNIAINEEKYQTVCKKRTEAANKRWNNDKDITSDANVCKSMQMHTNACIYDNDNDNVNENDNDNDNVNDACGAKRANKRKNYNNKNIPKLLQGEPSYDTDLFLRRTIGFDKVDFDKIKKGNSI